MSLWIARDDCDTLIHPEEKSTLRAGKKTFYLVMHTNKERMQAIMSWREVACSSCDRMTMYFEASYFAV